MRCRQPSLAPDTVRAAKRRDGTNGWNPSRIGEIQRARLLAAMTRAACEEGAARVTVASVVARAGVSRRTFYELFTDSEDCLLAALEDATARARERVLAAYLAANGGWRARVRAALATALELFDENPQIARLLVVEWLAAGPRALEHRQCTLAQVAQGLDEGGRAQIRRGPGPGPLAAEGAVGAVGLVLHERLLGDTPRREPLIELLHPLMSVIVLPYLGASTARRELGLPTPSAGASKEHDSPSESPLRGLNIRLTYRTLRVLTAIASDPGISNRAVAAAAGITDQGQISKLLKRLQRLGLIENSQSLDAGRGAPNAWALTAKGDLVERSLRS